MTTNQRLRLIADHVDFFAPYVGEFDLAALRDFQRCELASPDQLTRVVIPKNIVHVISGNTPHAAHQSLLHGLILGSKNQFKLPSNSLLDFEIPPVFADWVKISHDIPEDWIPNADALIVYGSDQTLEHFRALCPLEVHFIGHGQRIGIAIIDDPTPEAAALAARDIGLFDQQGCLSVQTIYLENPQAFAPLLAEAMADFEKEHPRSDLTPSEAGAITNFREEFRYLSAQEPTRHRLWHSDGSTAWTIAYEESPTFSLSPGNRTVFLRPLSDFSSHLPDFKFLSGIGLFPFEPRDDLPSPRIFPLGSAQAPPTFWAHDGIRPLSSLVKYQTLG